RSLAGHAGRGGASPDSSLEQVEKAKQAAGTVPATGFGACATVLPAELQALPAAERDEVLYRVAYAGYLAREQRQIARLADVEKIKIPADFDYAAVRGLRAES